MKRIFAVVGSPRRKGNTHILVSRIAEGARANGASVDEVLLGDMRIQECDGCHRCWQAKQCSKDDDMRGMYSRIADSDTIIFGTPVYWYGPTALMKAFIDRFVYFNCPENRPKIRGKKGVIAVVFEEDDPEMAALVIEFFTRSLKYLEMELAGKIIVPGVGAKGEILAKHASLEQAYKLGESLG
jgi:multimeric flavodoxin WrbA